MTTPETPDFLEPNPNPIPSASTYERPQWSPMAVMALYFGFVLVGILISGAVTFIGANNNGLNPATFQEELSDKSPAHVRNFLRLALFSSQVCLFLLPAFLTGLIVYKKSVFSFFKLDNSPIMGAMFLSLIWLFVSAPLVQLAYKINKMIPLPTFMMQMEDSTAKSLEAILNKDSLWEMLLNFFIIAVIAGIGEELTFRGLLQQQLGRIFKNEHAQVWLAAAIFSAIHMQFQGFLPRMFLGALLGYMFIWTRNLWVPIFVHLFNNGIQVIILYGAKAKPTEIAKVSNMEDIHWIWTLLSGIGCIALAYVIRENYYKKEENTEGVA